MNTAAKLYAEETRREYDRNRRYYRHGKGRRFLSVDEWLERFEQAKTSPSCISDHGESVERMIEEIDWHLSGEDDARLRLLSAMLVVAAFYPNLLYTLLLIVKNGKDKEKSICQLARYHRKNAIRQSKNIIQIYKN